MEAVTGVARGRVEWLGAKGCDTCQCHHVYALVVTTDQNHVPLLTYVGPLSTWL